MTSALFLKGDKMVQHTNSFIPLGERTQERWRIMAM